MTVDNNSYHMAAEALYEREVSDHAEWLKINGISYTVTAFRWPTMLSFIAGPRAISEEVVEFQLSIEDEKEAVMFRIFSGMAADVD